MGQPPQHCRKHSVINTLTQRAKIVFFQASTISARRRTSEGCFVETQVPQLGTKQGQDQKQLSELFKSRNVFTCLEKVENYGMSRYDFMCLDMSLCV